MLKLSRHTGETLVIQAETVITHFRIEYGLAKLGIKVPKSVKIWHGEIAEGK